MTATVAVGPPATPGRRRPRPKRLSSVARGIGIYARPHRGQLAGALVAAVAVVLARLAFPWPLRGIVELSLSQGHRTEWLLGLVPGRGQPVLWLAGAFAVLGLALGLSEHFLRLTVAKFSVRTVNDARLGELGRLFDSAAAGNARRKPGDVLTRLVGDTARIRVGMRGALVHLLQHGIFLIGVCAVLLAIDLRLGLTYLVGMLGAAGVALIGAARASAVARKRRAHESHLAQKILDAAVDPATMRPAKDAGRRRTGADVTKIKGFTAAAVQCVLAVTACSVLFFAVRLEEAGRLSAGDLVTVGSYLLMLHYPMSRLGRQVTRLGPLFVSAERVARLAERSHHRDEEPDAMPSTVAELIGASNPDEARAAAKSADAHAFILEFAQGYDTVVGNGGMPLSPSQQHRLELARRLVADPTAVLDRVAVEPPPPPYDPELPWLRHLLDTTVMAPLLARALRVDTAPEVRIRSVRYKPGKNAVVHYDVGTEKGWLQGVAYATAAPEELEAKLDSSRNIALATRVKRRTRATPSPLSYELETGALLQWLPLDMRLPALAKSGAKLTQRLEEAGLSVAEGEKPVLLRYWARRRAVLGFGDHIIKLYRDPLDFAQAERGLRAASQLDGVTVASFEAALPNLRATVQHRVRGCAPALRPGSCEPAGAVLARLHRATHPAPDAVGVSGTAELLAKAATRAQLVAQLVPGLEAEVRALLANLEARRPRGLPVVTSHGNFHAGQLIDTGDDLVVIDVDRLCRSHPGYDVAAYAAHLAFGRAGPPDELELVATAVESLVKGYGSRPDALGWFLATCLLRRAPVPFRYLDERWPDAAADLVRSAGQALDQ